MSSENLTNRHDGKLGEAAASFGLAAIHERLLTADMIETIAKVVDPVIWSSDIPVPTRGDVESFHQRRQKSCEVARRVVSALVETLQPELAAVGADFSRGALDERQRIIGWLDEQRKDVPAHGWEFAAALHAATDLQPPEQSKQPAEPSMGDDEFLSYCNGMADTPRCGFVPEQIARLIRLSGGDEELARKWDNLPNEVYSMDRWVVREAVTKARALLEAPLESLSP